MIVRRGGNLAAEMTSFVGRREEITMGAATLTERRLLTVTGPAGVGKSRTALRIAQALRRSCPDGLWHVELSRVPPGPRAEAALAGAVAHALGLDGAGFTAGGLAAALREHRALVILDTCDHLVAPVAHLARTLLDAAPRLQVVVTGRQATHARGERVLRLAPLPLADPTDPGPAGPSVDLFADRAVAVDPDFALTPETAPVVAEICRRVDGLPLAIELAAARTRSLSPAELLARLADGFSLLSSAGRAYPPRHRDLRSAVAWSHDLCDEPRRVLWAALAALKAPFDRAAAHRAAAGAGLKERVDELLADLADRSVVLREPPGDRFRMLAVYRWFALERRGLATGPWAAAPAPSGVRAGDSPGHSPDRVLTPRELQIAGLITEGLSNAQIAERLRIAKRTVDAHVRNILAKGRLASRTQIAAWFAERDRRPDV